MVVWCNLSIIALQIKGASIFIDVPKQLAIETCTYLTSELRTPFYSVITGSGSASKQSYCMVNEVYNTVKATALRPTLALALQFHMDHHEYGWLTHQISTYHPLSDLLWTFR